ncbi:GyrI-like domain-containing protein [Rhodococcus sp. T2V]|uniref:GyrI-like domain-containing protein n=1 Tax=Rhodococcus sp. T2V TaxID=3034164 RepID=UPI0023E32E50|nr:GyrI-like domain-containing protein [Rhodococcus sp. T2V]MDF3312763.1 GyrI-like domain-containing protein [Rhodococcus sp. T2V]
MGYEVELVEVDATPAAVVRGHVDWDRLGHFLGPAFGEVVAVADKQGRRISGAPFVRYRESADGQCDIEAGFPLSGRITARGQVQPTALPGGTVATTVHVGDYRGVCAAYDAAAHWISAHGYTVSGDPWECYLDGPRTAAPHTEVFIPCCDRNER